MFGVGESRFDGLSSELHAEYDSENWVNDYLFSAMHATNTREGWPRRWGKTLRGGAKPCNDGLRSSRLL